MKKNSQTKTLLEAQKRTVTGKKVKQLRKTGVIPANVFGPAFNSLSISVNHKDFLSAYKVAHETGIVYINVDKESIPTLIKGVQRHPVNHDILHVDFRKIDLKQKIETTVPIEIIGESIAVNQLGGVLLKQHDHLIVEALPQDIPQHIAVDISQIKEIGQEIKVADLVKSAQYTIKEEPEAVIVSVIAHKEESVTPETATVAPEVIGEAEKAEEGTAEGEEAPAPASAKAPASKEEKKE
ncbi:MAG: 50S ribosomal protein L25 [Candidatus Roizmanbacteria bacterium]|nr:MAG: 50S ribosomal protein L25 [Candidatus Roizmanbacteria bacterium]